MGETMSLSRDKILKAHDLKLEKLRVPEWGGDVYLRPLTGKGRDAYEAGVYDVNTKKVRAENVRALLVSLTVTDEKGELLFSPGDIESLGGKSAKALDRIFTAAQTMNAVSDAAMADVEGNSGAARSGASTST